MAMTTEWPTEIDGYRIDGVLGRGSTAVVLRAHDLELDRPVALKLLFADLDDDARARFALEARAASRLAHPNVVQVFAAGTHQGRAYLAQELIDGLPVSAILEARGTLSPDSALDLGLQIARALSAAEEAGVLHRDVKPDNMLVDDDGRAKLADFGLARIMSAQGRLTADGTTLGTPHYMSPEQGEGRPLDARSDQYALGATLYHLLTGTPPFDAEHVLAILLAHRESEVPPIRDRVPECSPRLASIVERMLAKSPEHRFVSFEAVIEALESVSELPETPVHVPRRRATLEALRRDSPLIAGAMTLASALVLTFGQRGPVAPVSAPIAIETVAAPIAPVPVAPPPAAPEPVKAEIAKRPLSSKPDVAALAARGDHSAVAALVPLLSATDDATAIAAAEALGSLGDLDALGPLEDAARTGRSAAVRAAAERARRRLWDVED